MPRMPKVLLCILILTGLSGCALYPPNFTPYDEGTKHYQTTNRFDRIAVSVEVANTDGLVQRENLAKSVTEAIAEYLEQNEIQYVSESDAISRPTARLALLVSPTATSDRTEYSILAKLTAPDGSLIDETPLFHKGGAASDDVLLQYLASTVVDDMLLLWYPSAAAGKYLASTADPAEYTLLANDPDPQTLGGVTRLSWEPFPSPRLLNKASVSATDISNVRYELRVHKPGLMTMNKRFLRSSIYRQKDIVEPWFEFPFLFPSCDYIIWSVRAHFTLAGQKRVTEWSGNYSTMYNRLTTFPALPPYMHRRTADQKSWHRIYRSFSHEHQTGGGTRARILPPEGVKCGELGRGFVADEARSADADFAEHIEALQPGESIATIATVDRICRTEDCVYEEGTLDASKDVAACLANEFKKRSLEVPVTDLASIFPSMSQSSESQASDTDAASKWIADPANKSLLQERGIRYVLDMQLAIAEGETIRDSDSNVLVTGAGWSTKYTVSIETQVIDTYSGQVLGTLASSDTGSKGGMVGFFLIVPIMYIPNPASISAIQNNACDAIARRMSFMLRGGVSTGWPAEYFNWIHEPLWATE